MNFLTISIAAKKYILFGFVLCFGQNFSQNVTLKQDPKIENLLTEKRKLNAAMANTTRYKIQIFIGNSEESKKTLIAFKKENRLTDATLIFSTPNYKVLVGNYKTRIEAERNLTILRKKFPKALLVKPNMN